MTTAVAQVVAKQQEEEESGGMLESYKKFLWREREARLLAVYSVEDALIELGEPVTRTRQKRVHR
jgi:hypothetical protein